MHTRKNEHRRANQQMGTLEQMGILGSKNIGANGFSGKMGTRKNEHQSKWALGKWVFGTNGHVGTGTMDVLENEHLGANGHFGTNEHWDRRVGVGGLGSRSEC